MSKILAIKYHIVGLSMSMKVFQLLFGWAQLVKFFLQQTFNFILL